MKSRGLGHTSVQYCGYDFKIPDFSIEQFFHHIMSSFLTKVLANAIGFGVVWTVVLMFHVRRDD